MNQHHDAFDFLLCRDSGGDTYSFKVGKKDRDMLFPESLLYKLDPNSTPHRGPLPRSIADRSKWHTNKKNNC